MWLQAPSSLRAILSQLTLLYALTQLQSDMAWLLVDGLVSPAFAREVPDTIRYTPLSSVLRLLSVKDFALSVRTGFLAELQQTGIWPWFAVADISIKRKLDWHHCN